MIMRGREDDGWVMMMMFLLMRGGEGKERNEV